MRPKSRIEFVDNVLHGIYMEWYEDGSIKTDCDTENGEFVVCR
jgi:antitoxin component YwqK of YwqJK toxin-antitoxin module